MMLATLAAILIVVSAATTSLAGQQRYEVREGDTIESFASSSGVDTLKRLTDDGAHFVVAGMHVVTVYAHDDEVVMVMDLVRGAKVHHSWNFFVQIWTVVDDASLATSPF